MWESLTWHAHGVLDCVRSIGMRLLMLTAERRVVHGVELFAVSGDSGLDSRFLGTFSDALDMLNAAVPYRFARMARDLSRVVFIFLGGGYYSSRLDAFVTSATIMNSVTPAEAAMHFVHEAMHARLYRRGCKYTRSTRRRHEELCLRRELEIAALLPDSQQAIARRSALVGTEWWTPEARTARNRRMMRELRALLWRR